VANGVFIKKSPPNSNVLASDIQDKSSSAISLMNSPGTQQGGSIINLPISYQAGPSNSGSHQIITDPPFIERDFSRAQSSSKNVVINKEAMFDQPHVPISHPISFVSPSNDAEEDLVKENTGPPPSSLVLTSSSSIAASNVPFTTHDGTTSSSRLACPLPRAEIAEIQIQTTSRSQSGVLENGGGVLAAVAKSIPDIQSYPTQLQESSEKEMIRNDVISHMSIAVSFKERSFKNLLKQGEDIVGEDEKFATLAETTAFHDAVDECHDSAHCVKPAMTSSAASADVLATTSTSGTAATMAHCIRHDIITDLRPAIADPAKTVPTPMDCSPLPPPPLPPPPLSPPPPPSSSSWRRPAKASSDGRKADSSSPNPSKTWPSDDRISERLRRTSTKTSAALPTAARRSLRTSIRPLTVLSSCSSDPNCSAADPPRASEIAPSPPTPHISDCMETGSDAEMDPEAAAAAAAAVLECPPPPAPPPPPPTFKADRRSRAVA